MPKNRKYPNEEGAVWIVSRATDGHILCTDKMWRSWVAGIEDIKVYSSVGRALRYGLGNQNGTVYCQRVGETLDRFGRVYTAKGELKTCGSDKSRQFYNGGRPYEHDRPVYL